MGVFFDLESEIMPLVYEIKISGNGTNPPTVTAVIADTIGGTAVWTRNSTANYTITNPGKFALGKTFISSANGSGPASGVQHIHVDVNSINIVFATFPDSNIVDTFIKIEVWP